MIYSLLLNYANSKIPTKNIIMLVMRKSQRISVLNYNYLFLIVYVARCVPVYEYVLINV